MQFYTQVLSDSHFVGDSQEDRRRERASYNPMILYCYLAWHSAMHYGGVFSYEDNFDPDKMRELEGDNVMMQNFSKSRISEDTNISRRDIYNALRYLEEKELVCGGEIYIINGLFSGQYFELQPSSVIKGVDLIVFSYIVRKYELLVAKYGEGNEKAIDTWARTIAKNLGMSYHTVSHALHRCQKAGCLARTYQGEGINRRPILRITAPIFSNR